jgi:hypothetical protein
MERKLFFLLQPARQPWRALDSSVPTVRYMMATVTNYAFLLKKKTHFVAGEGYNLPAL